MFTTPRAKVLAASLSLAAAVAGTGIGLTQAQAADTTGTVGNTGGIGLLVRSSPSTTAAAVTTVPSGTRITITCQARGARVTNLSGFSSDLWDYVPSRGGYVADAFINTGHDGPVPGVPTCGSTPTKPPTTKPPTTKPPTTKPPTNGGSLCKKPYPGGSWATVKADLEKGTGFTFTDDTQSWANQPSELHKLWWTTLADLACTEMLTTINKRDATGSLEIRATHNDQSEGMVWGHYHTNRLNIDFAQMNDWSKADAGTQRWFVAHELTHAYETPTRGQDRPWYTVYQNALAAEGPISGYGKDQETENLADVIGYFVAPCKGENGINGGQNPYSRGYKASYAFARDQVFGGRTFTC